MSDEPNRPAEKPTILAGKYELKDLLHKSRAGQIYEATNRDTGRAVAVKVFRSDALDRPETMERMAEQVQAVASSGCENLVQILDMEFAPKDGSPAVVVMELLQGETLEQRLKRSGTLSLKKSVRVTLQLLEAVKVMHTNGVAHGALSPDSVLLTQWAGHQDFVKLLGPYPASPDEKLSASDDLKAVGSVLARCLLGTAASPDLTTEGLIAQLKDPAEEQEVAEKDLATLASTCFEALNGEFTSAVLMTKKLETTELAQIESTGESISFDSLPPAGVPTEWVDQTGPTVVEKRTPPPGTHLSEGFRTRAPSSELSATTSIGRRRTTVSAVAIGAAAGGLILGIAATIALQTVLKKPKKSGAAGPAARVPDPRARPAGAEKRPLRFAIAYNSPPLLVRQEMKGVARYLSIRVGRPVKVVNVPHKQVAERLEGGGLDLAVFSPYLYVLSRMKHPKFLLLATHLSDGALTYEGYIVTPERSTVRTIPDLKGKRVCFVTRTSTSGYLFPKALMRRAGVEIERDLKQLKFSGTHEAAIEDLTAGKCDAAAVYSSAYLDAVVNKTAGLRIVATTERIPGDAYCASPHLSPRTLSKLKRALLVFEPQRDMKKKFLGPVHRITGFVLVNERHYDPIRRMHHLLHGEDTKRRRRGLRRPR